MSPATRTSPTVTVVAILIVGYAYGWAISSIPAPKDPELFWVANLSAPFLALPFLAAAWASARRRLSRWHAALLGGASGATMIAGFYRLHRVGREHHADSGRADGIVGDYKRWFSTFLIGRPGGIPWLSIGIVTGVVAGLLAWSWSVRKVKASAMLAAGALLIEPVARFALGPRDLPMFHGFPRTPPNLAIWACEAAVGIAALFVIRRRADCLQRGLNQNTGLLAKTK